MEQKPLRVAQILSKMNSGGIEAVVMNYYRHIDRTAVQFDFFLQQDSTVPCRAEIEAMGGRIYFLPPYTKFRAYFKTLSGLLRETECRVAHVHMNTLSGFALKAAKAAGVPVRLIHNHSTANRAERKRTLIKYLLRPTAARDATDLLACSAAAGQWMFGRRKLAAGKVKLIPNAIDVDRFAFSPSARTQARQALGVDGRLVVLHVGRFMRQKNHAFLLDIFQKLAEKEKNAVLLLAGEGELEAEILTRAKRLGIAQSVRFLGVRDDVALLMQAADVLILPSLYEGLPVVGVEAQAAALPCLFSDQVTQEAALTDTVRFLPLGLSAEDWADAAISLAGLSRRDQSRQIMEKGYDIRLAAQDLKAYYLSLEKRIAD